MTAVVESDWLPCKFTMNYRFTQPVRVQWKAGELYAQLCVVRAGIQEGVQPVIHQLEEDERLAANHAAWRERGTRMRARLEARDPAALKDGWDSRTRFCLARETSPPRSACRRQRRGLGTGHRRTDAAR